MEKYCINIDWLQTFNHGDLLAPGTYTGKENVFVVKKLSYETPVFLDNYAVYRKDYQVATVSQHPRNSVIHPRATVVKMENRVLYHQGYIALLYDLNIAFNLQYKGITRLDLCYDCNVLAGGRSVPKFLREFIVHEPLTPGHIIRSGSNRFIANGTRKSTSVANITAMRWGSPNNDVTAYCYDKTLEMLEVKRKPWILETWEKNGLEFDVDFDGFEKLTDKQKTRKINSGDTCDYVNKKVWRFEISIRSKGNDILNMRTGELFRLAPEYLQHAEQVHKLFHIYAKKVFDFRINGGVKRIRDYSPLIIFEKEMKISAKPFYMSKSADTGRIERLCYNKLDQLNRQYNDMAEPFRKSILSVLDFLNALSGVKYESVRLRRQMKYLDQLRAEKFLAYDDYYYLSCLEMLRDSREELDSAEIYNLLYANRSLSIEEEEELYKEVPPISDQEVTPEEYIW